MMAVDTLEALKFILNDLDPVSNYFLVAGGAFHLGMFALQFEGSGIMVEFFGLPVFEGMAPGAVRHPVFLELAVVHILMAGTAVGA